LLIVQIRKFWRLYFEGTQGLVFVVDSNDHDRIVEAAKELHSLLMDDWLRDVPVLIFANKQDLPGAMSVPEVTEKLGLHSFVTRQWYIEPTNAGTGHGLHEGLDWLSSAICSNR
tara:strand:- start:1124 stop:1465 length:342 start_codon:yes stop_codon:yes gene_type:complete